MRSTIRLRSMSMAVFIATGFTGTALAADISAPPPPFIAPPQPQMEVGGGFYLRGDVGMGMYDYSELDLYPLNHTRSKMSGDIKSTVFAGVGAGYAFNSWLRTDATVEYRAPSRFTVATAGSDTSTPVKYGSNITKGKMSAIVALANGYVDLGTWSRITPYIGAGIGAAYISTSDTYDYAYGEFGTPQGVESGKAPDKSKTNLAWAIHAGMSYDLASNLKADIGYRYLNMGDVESGTVACYTPCSPGYNVKVKSLDSQDIKVGFRYIFNEAAPALYAPEPIIRKY